MPNIAAVLKSEISRIARKETKAALLGVLKSSARLRRAAADSNVRLVHLEREIRSLNARIEQLSSEERPADATTVETTRLTAKAVRSLRGRLGLTQAQFALLAGISAQTVYLWENKVGPLRLRDTTRAALLAVRGFSASEARQTLEQKQASKKQRSKRRTKP